MAVLTNITSAHMPDSRSFRSFLVVVGVVMLLSLLHVVALEGESSETDRGGWNRTKQQLRVVGVPVGNFHDKP